MKKQLPRPTSSLVLVCLVGLLASCGGGSGDQAIPAGVAAASTGGLSGGSTDQIIVKPANAGLLEAYEARASEFAAVLSADAGLQLRAVRKTHDGGHVMALPTVMSSAEIEQLTQRLARRADVRYAEPDVILQASFIPNDPTFSQLWPLREAAVAAGGLNAVDAWDITTGDPGLVVAVVDSGVLAHADFAGRVLPGYDFVSSVAGANDGNGRDADATDSGDWISFSEATQLGRTARPSSWHGTHVAGTIGATGNNGAGISGVNWRSRILPVRVLGKGGGYSSDIADGIAWAAGASVVGVPVNRTPARVINLSLGGGGLCSRTAQEAIDFATSRSAVVVVAAGNEATDAANSQPANCRGVISVAAVGLSGQRASYSNFGTAVTVSAPGGDPSRDTGVLSLGDSGQTRALGDNSLVAGFGTSMAAPHVSGVVSLMLSVNPALTPAQVKSILQSSGRAFPVGTGRDCNTSLCGAGIVNAGAAVRAAASATAEVASAVPQSGIWWNPSEPGRGYVLEIRDGKLQFGAYLYDAAGLATWYTSGPASMQSASSYTGSLDLNFGGQTLAGAYKPPASQSSLGKVTLQFQSPTTATLSWPGGTIPIQRFRFGSGTTTSATAFAPEPGVWWSPQEAGRGYAIEVQDGSLSVAGFMYDAVGNPTWYLAVGPLSSGKSFSAQFVQYGSGQPLAGAYKAPVLSNPAAGAVSLQFADTANAVMTLPNGKVIELQKFRIGYAAPSLTVPVNQVLTSRLVGIWGMTYQIASNLTDYYLFNEVRESASEPGTYNVWGINQYESPAIGGWSPSIGHYTIYNAGPMFDDFYVFDMPASDSMSGCYYLGFRNPTRLSSCYAFGGAKLAELAPFDGLAKLPRPERDANARSVLIAQENAQLEGQSAGTRGILKSAPAQGTVLARKPEVDRLIRTIDHLRAQAR